MAAALSQPPRVASPSPALLRKAYPCWLPPKPHQADQDRRDAVKSFTAQTNPSCPKDPSKKQLPYPFPSKKEIGQEGAQRAATSYTGSWELGGFLLASCVWEWENTARFGDYHREKMSNPNYPRLALSIKQSQSKLVSVGFLSWPGWTICTPAALTSRAGFSIVKFQGRQFIARSIFS